MPKTTEKDKTEKDKILEYLNSYPGKRFRTAYLSNRFGVSNIIMRKMLDEMMEGGLVSSIRISSATLWTVVINEKNRLMEAEKATYEFKKLNQTYIDSMRRVLDNIAERA